MTTLIERIVSDGTAVLTNSLSTTETIDMDGFSTLQVHIPAGYQSTTLTIYAQSKQTGWLPLRDDANAAVAPTIAAGTARNIPVAAFNSQRIRLVTNNAADNAVVVGVVRKS